MSDAETENDLEPDTGTDTDTDTDTEGFPRYTCPSCGQHTVVPEIYGMPSGELFEMADRGEVVLGGCCIMPDYTGREVACTGCGWLGNATRDGTKVRKRPAAKWDA